MFVGSSLLVYWRTEIWKAKLTPSAQTDTFLVILLSSKLCGFTCTRARSSFAKSPEVSPETSFSSSFLNTVHMQIGINVRVNKCKNVITFLIIWKVRTLASLEKRGYTYTPCKHFWYPSVLHCSVSRLSQSGSLHQFPDPGWMKYLVSGSATEQNRKSPTATTAWI